MLTENKITEIFVMVDEFCKVFDAMLHRRGLSAPRNDRKRDYHRDCRMSQAEILAIRRIHLWQARRRQGVHRQRPVQQTLH